MSSSRARRALLALASLLVCSGGLVRAQASVGSIEVAWNPNVTDPDLAGYRLYVDDDPNTFTLAPSAAKPLAFKTFDVGTGVVDQVVGNLDSTKVWFFGVTSLDVSGNESGFSNVISAQPSVTPTIRTVTPTTALQGQGGITVTITGSNFVSTSAVSFGPGISVGTVTTTGVPTTLVATVNVAALAQAKQYSLTVTNPGGSSAVKVNAITVGVRPGRADIDGSNRIDGGDFVSMLLGFPSTVGDAHYNTNIDMDLDGNVDGADLAIFFSFLGMVGPFP
ncbi:MAG: hypothetical protein HY049_06420 [Acidobacteria bacterium]|nr:hypothetical protein [Acidobacteriota bacterium]